MTKDELDTQLSVIHNDVENMVSLFGVIALHYNDYTDAALIQYISQFRDFADHLSERIDMIRDESTS